MALELSPIIPLLAGLSPQQPSRCISAGVMVHLSDWSRPVGTAGGYVQKSRQYDGFGLKNRVDYFCQP